MAKFRLGVQQSAAPLTSFSAKAARPRPHFGRFGQICAWPTLLPPGVASGELRKKPGIPAPVEALPLWQEPAPPYTSLSQRRADHYLSSSDLGTNASDSAFSGSTSQVLQHSSSGPLVASTSLCRFGPVLSLEIGQSPPLSLSRCGLRPSSLQFGHPALAVC